jgi:nicotinamidase-related amidase
MTSAGLPLTAKSVHVVIDMQELFASHPDWGIPTAGSIVEGVSALARHRPDRTLWTRFIPARNASLARGCWRPYFERWPRATLDSGASVELLPALRVLASPGSIFDKEGYSAFENPRFLERLRKMEADTLVLSGAETDICVLSTALNAIDCGLFVVLAVDAMTSNDLASHKATLEIVMPRYQPQIRLASVAEILKTWR